VALYLLGVKTPGELAALCIGLGAFSAPLAYDLGRTLGDERRGRLAGVLTAFSPAILLFGVTSVDYAFTTIGLAVACLLARQGQGRGWLIAGSILAGIASFFSWLLLAIPAWAAVVALRRHGWGRAAALSLSVGAAVVAWNGLMAMVYRYDPFSALSATASAYSHGIATIRPYWFWVFGSPAAWIVMLGLPVAWLSLRSLSARDTAAIAVWALVVVSSVIGFTKAETERVWLPFVPLACIAAASALPAALSAGRLRLLLGVLAAQALVIELLFFTVW
jgi:methylthioxylose transferase